MRLANVTEVKGAELNLKVCAPLPPQEGRTFFFKGISVRSKNAACLIGVEGRGNIFEELLSARHYALLLHVYNTYTIM